MWNRRSWGSNHTPALTPDLDLRSSLPQQILLPQVCDNNYVYGEKTVTSSHSLIVLLGRFNIVWSERCLLPEHWFQRRASLLYMYLERGAQPAVGSGLL